MSKIIFVQIQALMQIPSYIFRFWQKHISDSKCYLKRFEYSYTIMVFFSKAFLNKRTILELLRFKFYVFKITEIFLLFCFLLKLLYVAFESIDFFQKMNCRCLNWLNWPTKFFFYSENAFCKIGFNLFLS